MRKPQLGGQPWLKSRPLGVVTLTAVIILRHAGLPMWLQAFRISGEGGVFKTEPRKEPI